jgi:hypothetical protein
MICVSARARMYKEALYFTAEPAFLNCDNESASTH